MREEGQSTKKKKHESRPHVYLFIYFYLGLRAEPTVLVCGSCLSLFLCYGVGQIEQ